MDDEKHYPPGAEPEQKPADEQPKEEAHEAEEAKPDQPKQEETPKPEEDKAEDKESPADQIKKRSIYEDYKEKKQEAKDAIARAEAAEAKAAELQALLDKKSEAITPKENADADADIEDFLKEEGLTIEQVDKLAKVIEKRIGSQKLPEDVQKKLDEIDAWKKSQEATRQQAEEDRQIMASVSQVKSQLDIYDEAELGNVMKEIVKLAHTPQFHDKEVEYIVWKNKDALSKLISPKKKSFEQGDSRTMQGSEADVDFSKGSVTPEQAQKATQGGNRATYEITRAK